MIWGRKYHESQRLSTEVGPGNIDEFYHALKACRLPKYLKYVWVPNERSNGNLLIIGCCL